ncbi:hypothetical protein [Cellulomonas sp.]|uniref:hypothetical protein n=1 Tax=Cellulomonas sp. TaxID=40001 RepID=UPI003BABA00E
MTAPTLSRADRVATVLTQIAAVLAVTVGMATQLRGTELGLPPDLGWAIGTTVVVLLSAAASLPGRAAARIAVLHVVPALLLSRWWWSGPRDTSWVVWWDASAGAAAALVVPAVRVAVPVLLGLLWMLTGIGVVTHVQVFRGRRRASSAR